MYAIYVPKILLKFEIKFSSSNSKAAN